MNQAMQYFLSNLGLLILTPKGTLPECPTGFDFRNLFCFKEVPGMLAPDRMAQQYNRSNIDPTELYVLSCKGTAQYRLNAWESGIKNLTLVGDWIYTGFNTGASMSFFFFNYFLKRKPTNFIYLLVEAAVMSGALGSFALTGSPDPEKIQGYFFLHPNQRPLTKNVPHPLGKQ